MKLYGYLIEQPDQNDSRVKFIIKSDNRSMALVEVIFDDDAEIIQKQSAKGNYISITVKQVVMSVDEIISIYEKAAEIEGVISL